MRKPWGIIVLLVWFLWITGRSITGLISGRDYELYSSYGVGPVYLALTVLTAGVGIATVYYLITPSRVGLYVVVSSILLSIVTTFASAVVVLSDVNIAKLAYIAGRRARGLSVHVDLIDAFLTPGVIIVIAIVLLSFDLLLGFVLYRNRDYFLCRSRVNAT